MNYKKFLINFLVSQGLSENSAKVYISGTRNKKPNADVRYKAYIELGHPFNAWGTKLKAYIEARNKLNSEF